MRTRSTRASRHGSRASGRCTSHHRPRPPPSGTLLSWCSDDLLSITCPASCRAIVYNPRGTAGTPVATPHFYSASYTADLRAVINSLQQQYPRTPLAACGYSLGANILCRSGSWCRGGRFCRAWSAGPAASLSESGYHKVAQHASAYASAGTWVRRAAAHP